MQYVDKMQKFSVKYVGSDNYRWALNDEYCLYSE